MRKDRLYLYTFLAITIIFVIIASISIKYLVKESAIQSLSIQLESSKREAKEIASLIDFQLNNGLDQNIIKANIQENIKNSNLETGFISVFDWSGEQICHPDITRVSTQIQPNEALVTSISDNISVKAFYDIVKTIKLNDIDNDQKIYKTVYQASVPNIDWIVGAHINIEKLLVQIKALRTQFYIIITIMGFIVILTSVTITRAIGSLYEKNLETKNKKLEDEVINLAKLNKAIDRFQQKASEEQQESKLTPKTNTLDTKEQGKKRILTYLRHEILPVSTEDIAYIYTENTITYVVDKNGKRSTVNTSLDELQSSFDSNLFYRANRQFIISIIAIEKIIRYGNNQLKILMTPESENDIIIGKNKAAEFKQWLNL